MARAFNVASRRISAERVKRKLDNRFVGTETEYTAAGFGSGGVYINGRVYQSNDVGVGVVKNVGRPAAAFYASAEGGGGSVVISGGGSSSSGGGAVDGDYLLRSGILPMLGNLDMGNRAITNVSLVDGRDVAVDGAVLDSIKGASLLALAVNDALTSERALVLSNAFSITDGGAGNNYSVALATPGSLSATSENNAAGSHSHAVTASDNPGATVSLLKTAADGNLTLTQLTTPLITTATNIDLVLNPAGTGAVQFPNDQKLRTSSFDSSFPILGWQINEVEGITGYSSLTIGKIQADELAVRVFVADEVRVDRGDEYWTKSYGIVAETFTSPSAIDGTVSVMFEDSPALAGAIFSNNDWVLFRKLEIDTGISLFNLWGQVSSYVDNGDGTQNWTFTLKIGPTSEEILKGSLAIDFGASGAALIHLSVIDSAGAPYIKMRKWVTNPYTPANYTTYIQLGNLGSIGNAYYTPSGYGFYIRSTANEDQFMVADDNGFQIRGASFSLYNGSDQTVLMDNASGINLDEDVWGSWDNRRALQWWPDVSSMTGDPSLSIYTGKVNGGFTDQQNFSYIDANPTGGELAGLSISAFGQGTANDALIYLEGGSQSLTTVSSVTVTADSIDLVGTTSMGTGRASQFNPTSDLGANLGTTLLRWNILYVDQIIVSGSISGDVLSGQEWEYPGSMVIDANSATNTTVTITNQGTGTASLDVEGSITLAGTVDGVDIALFKSGYDSHVANVNGHHNRDHVLATTSALGSDHSVSGLTTGLVLRATGATTAAFTQLQHSELGGLTTGDPHTQYLLRAGGTITGNVTVNTGITIDGIDISAHAADINAHHAMQHDITSSSVHTITSSTLGLVGATATNTLGIVTPSANPGVAPAVLRTDNNGILTLVQFTATTKLQTPTIDTASGNLLLAPASQTVMVTGSTEAAALFATTGTGTTNGDGLYIGYTSQAWLWNYENTALSLGTNNTARLSIAGDGNITTNGVALGSNNYASQVTGWRIDSLGGGDFRYLYTDQMHAKSFVADLEQALAGSQIISKSVTTIAQAFIAPYPGSTLPLYVDDLPSAENMAVFESGDFVRIRQFSRASGTLSIADCWGTVSSYTDQANKIQRWNFTRSGTATTNTIAQVDTATTSTSSASTSRTVTKVTGTATGHFMIAQVVINSTSVTITPPAGWTLFASGSVTGAQLAVYVKVAGGSEPANYTFSFSSSVACAVTLQCLSNVSSNYTYQVNTNTTPTNSMVGTAVTALSSTDYLLFFGGVVGNVRATPPSGMTEISDVGSTGVGAYVAAQTVTAGDTGNKTATLASNAAYVCITMTLLPTYAVGGLDTTSGTMFPGAIVAADTVVLDYGVSGNGWHEVTAVDGAYGSNSPYSQVANWTTHPATGAVVRTRLGNLKGIFGAGDEYGLYAGNGVTATSNYLRISNVAAGFNNIPIKLYNAGIQTVNIDSAGTDIWIGPSSADKRLAWNGTSLSLANSDISLYSGVNKMVGLNATYGLDYQIGTNYTDEIPTITWRATAGTGSALARVAAYQTVSETGMDIRVLPPDTSHDGAISIVAYNSDLSNAAGIVFDTPAIGTTTATLSIYGNIVEFVSNPLTVTLTHGDLDMNGNDIIDIGNITGNISTWNNLSFGSGWTSFGGGFNNGQYKKVGDLVFLRGLVKRTSGTGTTIATLPAGYRPSTQCVFITNATDAFGRVDVRTDGVILLNNGTATYVQLDGIVFSTA